MSDKEINWKDYSVEDLFKSVENKFEKFEKISGTWKKALSAKDIHIQIDSDTTTYQTCSCCWSCRKDDHWSKNRNHGKLLASSAPADNFNWNWAEFSLTHPPWQKK